MVILGSSFIGMEAAAYLATSKAGVNITVVGMEKVAMLPPSCLLTVPSPHLRRPPPGAL